MYIHCGLVDKVPSRDEAAHSEHGLLIQRDIGPKSVERSENEYMNLELIVNTYSMFIGPHFSKGLYYSDRPV
jgi:hypothetical protein